MPELTVDHGPCPGQHAGRRGVAKPAGPHEALDGHARPDQGFFHHRLNAPIRHGQHEVALYDHENQLMWTASVNNLSLEPGLHNLTYRLPSLPLQPGAYHWQVSIWDGGAMYDVWECMPEMIISTEPHAQLGEEYGGVLRLPWQFQLEKRQ